MDGGGGPSWFFIRVRLFNLGGKQNQIIYYIMFLKVINK